MIKRSWSLKNFIRDKGDNEAMRVMGYPKYWSLYSRRRGKDTFIVQIDYRVYSIWRNLEKLWEVDI